MAKTKVFISGASGFVGSHLVEHLSENSTYELFGTVYGHGSEFLEQYLAPTSIIPLNLLDRDKVFEVVKEVQPDWIIHLAALTSPAKSFESAAATYNNNITTQLNLLDAALDLDKLPRTLVVGSAEEYGQVLEDENPIDENTPLRPGSPYAVSKIAQDYMGYQYYLTHKLPVIRVRPFNHTGERRPPTFVLPAFAKQVAQIEAGTIEPKMNVGNLEPVRDFTDVKDMVRAYELALKKGQPGEVYNVGSGKPTQIQTLLDMLLSFSDKEIEVTIDPEKFRPVDVPMLVANHNKFTRDTGWQPQIPLEDTIKRVLDYWRQQVSE